MHRPVERKDDGDVEQPAAGLFRADQGHASLFDGGVEVVAPFGPGTWVGLETRKAEGLEGDVDQGRAAVALAVADQLFLRIEAGLFDDGAQLRLGT